MVKFISLLLLLVSSTAYGQLKPVERAEFLYKNLVPNPGFETGKTDWEASVPSNLSNVTGGGAIHNRSLSWDPTAASETFCMKDPVTLTELEKGKRCIAEISYKSTTLGTGDITFNVEDGSGNLQCIDKDLIATPPGGGALKAFCAFPCPTSGSLKICLTSTADAANTIFDEARISQDYRIGSQPPELSNWKSFSPTASITTNVTHTGYWRRVGSDMEVIVYSDFTGVTDSTAVEYTLPKSKTIDGNISDPAGTTVYGPAVAFDVSTGASYQGRISYATNTTLFFRYFTDQSTEEKTATLNVGAGASPFQSDNGDRLWTRFTVPIEEWRDSGVTNEVTLDTQDWFLDVSISGSNVDMGVTADSGTFSDVDNAGLTLTENPSNTAQVYIACNNAEEGTGATCSTENEVVGYTTWIPRPGKYMVLLKGTHAAQGDSGDLLVSALRIDHTGDTSDAFITEGELNYRFALESNNATKDSQVPAVVTQTFEFDSAGQKTIRLKEQTEVTGTPNVNDLLCGSNGGLSYECQFVMFPIKESISQAVALTGTPKWEANFPAFYAVRTSIQNFADSVPEQVIFDTATTDLGGDFNTTTGDFTAPYDGLYQFNASVTSVEAANIERAQCYFTGTFGNNILIGDFEDDAPDTVQDVVSTLTFSGGATINLTAGETVGVQCNILVTGGTPQVRGDGATDYTAFSGHLVSRL